MKRLSLALLSLALASSTAFAQQRTITGKVTSEQGTPLNGVAVSVKGTATTATTNTQGNYSIAADAGQVLQFRMIGTALVERTVGTEDVINVQLRRVALDLDAVVVTALGETAMQRSLGTAQQTVGGSDIAQTQRENFFNALSGRVAGVDVTATVKSDLDLTVDKGVYVTYVTNGGPADDAGLIGAFASQSQANNSQQLVKGGDVIVKVDGQDVTGIDQLASYLDLNKRPGDTVELGIVRDGKEQTITATLADWPSA